MLFRTSAEVLLPYSLPLHECFYGAGDFRDHKPLTSYLPRLRAAEEIGSEYCVPGLCEPQHEEGLMNVIVKPDAYERYYRVMRNSPLLIVEGTVQRQGVILKLLARAPIVIKGRLQHRPPKGRVT